MLLLLAELSTVCGTETTVLTLEYYKLISSQKIITTDSRANASKSTPAMPITAEEGREFAESFLKAAAEGFPKNNHREFFGRFLADELSWDWSDGTKVRVDLNFIILIAYTNMRSLTCCSTGRRNLQ